MVLSQVLVKLVPVLVLVKTQMGSQLSGEFPVPVETSTAPSMTWQRLIG